MNQAVKSSLALGVLALAIGCGGSGGNGGPTGTLCKSSANPIPVALEGGQKIDLDPGVGEITSLLGSYQFVSSEVFYKRDKGPMIHIREDKSNKTGKPATSIVCVAGFTQQTAPFRYKTSVVSSLEVRDGNRVTFKVRDYTVGYGDRIIKDAEDNGTGGVEAPKKVYDGIASEFAFYKANPKDDTLFETRALIKNGDESISTIVRYKRCGFTGNECPPETVEKPAPTSR